MSQTTEERSEQLQQSATAVERAEELISRMEQRIGTLPALFDQRARQARARISEQVKQSGTNQQSEQAKQSGTNQQGEQAEQPNQPTMEKADKLVEEMGQRMGLIGAIVSLQTRKITARVRENAEDMWAEIEQIRNGRDIKQQ